jgi:acetylornithine deacetylase
VTTQLNTLETALGIADRCEDESIALLQELVRIESPTGEEGPAQRRVAQELAALDAVVSMEEPDLAALFSHYPHVAQYPTHWRHPLELPYRRLPSLADFDNSGLADIVGYSGRPNVVAHLRGTGGGRSLILNSHIDTVTPEPVQAWNHYPYSADLDNGRIYGRGTSDMKAGLCACILALRYLRRAGAQLAGDVIVQSVVNEEHSGNGTLDLMRRGISADAAIVLEPTGGDVFISTPGALYWKVFATGIPRHPAARWEGLRLVGASAIETLTPVVASWQEMEIAYRQAPGDPLLRNDAYFSLVIGLISGGTYEGATAQSANLAGGLYFPPDAGPVDSVMEAMETRISALNEQWHRQIGISPLELAFLHHDDPSDPALVRAHNLPFAEWVADTLRTEPAPSVSSAPFACDLRHLINQQPHIPTVVFGPGSIGQAHAPDEYIEVRDYLGFIRQLTEVIFNWCNQRPESQPTRPA